MGGITGIYNLDEKSIVSHDIRKMNKIISHRGPDSESYIFIDTKNRIWSYENRNNYNLTLGNNRLAIYNLSKKEPMSNEDKTIWITFDGAIYNYIEIRNTLKKRGHRFVSETDAEVIVHSYEEWAEDCVKKFNGQWAFAIWDNKKNKLFISRDRFGVCPIYYFYNENTFIFASEIKAILSIIKENKINYSTLYYFLKNGIIENTEETFFKNIKILQPAHSIIIEKGKIKIYKYWDTPIFKPNKEEFIELLKDAINLRIKLDVPFGVALSGGIDSSTIVCLLNEPINTFSVVWDEKEGDESYFINIVEKNTKIKKHWIKPSPNNFFDEVEKITWHQEIPTPSPSIYAQWQLMKLAKSNGIKVLLDGQGCDEILAGYPKYFIYYAITLLRKGDFIKLLKEEKKISETIKSNLFKAVVREIFTPVFNILDNVRKKEQLLQIDKEFENYIKSSRQTIDDNHIEKKKFMDPLNFILYLDLTKNSIPGLLHYGDRNSMAFSIQLRNPFLDYRFVELCMNLPFYEKINCDSTKFILREKMKNILPEEIIKRKDKKGFPAPIGNWFRNELKNTTQEIIYSLNKRKLFNSKNLDTLLKLHLGGKENYYQEIWKLITIEIWFRKFIDK